LTEYLTRAEVPGWCDEGTAAGTRWTSVVLPRIDARLAFVVVMTPVAVQSHWVSR
jgi:hypothetical protein